MSDVRDIGPARGPAGDRQGLARFTLIAAAVVFVAYTVTLLFARTEGLWLALLGALANTVPIIVFGLLARQVVVRWIMGRPTAIQWLGHLIAGPVFAVLAYWLLLVLLGLVHGVSATEFDVRPFDPRAMAWQTLQNLTTYGVIAALCYAQARPASSGLFMPVQPGAEAEPGGFSRYFIRSGDDIRPIDVETVVSITGADDYAEVSTMDGSHLVRMTLAEFETALDPNRFLRVHRSHIVNLHRVARVEPAGNARMLLHMENGQRVQTSRAGARLMRDRVL